MATPSFKRFRGMLPAWRGVAKVVARRPSPVAVSKRSSFWSAVHKFPCIPPLEILVAGISGPPFAAPLAPLPLTSRVCRCGRPLDSCFHHRAACSRAGVLGSRGYALESAAARVCREAGGRDSTNVLLRDMALDTVQADGRRLEVVVDGLPLFRGAQLAIDTTLVSPLRGDGQLHRRCADVDGAALDEARRRKERTNPGCANATAEQDWSSWLLKLGADGRTRPPTSSSNSPRRRREVCLVFCKSGQDRLGRCGGVPCWLAAVLELSRCRSLTGVLLWVWMVTLLRPLMRWEMSAVCL